MARKRSARGCSRWCPDEDTAVEARVKLLRTVDAPPLPRLVARLPWPVALLRWLPASLPESAPAAALAAPAGRALGALDPAACRNPAARPFNSLGAQLGCLSFLSSSSAASMSLERSTEYTLPPSRSSRR